MPQYEGIWVVEAHPLGISKRTERDQDVEKSRGEIQIVILRRQKQKSSILDMQHEAMRDSWL